MLSDNMEDIIELGVSVDIIADWENGIFTDNFDGYWLSLPDGQILAVYVVDECDGYDVYTSPVIINGEEYVFDGEPQIYFDLLFNGEYFYCFTIDDIFGDYRVTDFINFTVDGENIYYTDLSE